VIGHDPGILAGKKVQRFAEYWQGLGRNGLLPSRLELDPGAFTFCLSNVLLMDLSHDPLRVRYRLVGTAVVTICKLDFTGRYLDELTFPNPHFDWMNVYRMLVADRRPVYGLVPLESTHGQPKFDLGLFPLSSDGGLIDKAVAVEDYDPIGGWLEHAHIASARLATDRNWD
jgi:hypothetical protein